MSPLLRRCLRATFAAQVTGTLVVIVIVVLSCAVPGGCGRTSSPRTLPAPQVAPGSDATTDAALAVQSPRDGAGGDTPIPESLSVEERERDPASEAITIKVLVDPPQRAHVYWGTKDFGFAPLEITRPRGSGPVDLILRAPGYLTVHTRAFTDRDDKIAIHLVPETDAPRMFGYRSQ